VAKRAANPATVRLLAVVVSMRGIAMRRGIRRRLGQVAVVMVALPLVGWLLEEAAKRAETRKSGSASGRWLRQGSEWAHRFGRGPLSSRLRTRR
jgi:hypothetical protein